ncbi:hypothetical protein CF327_g1500 [Tilletia walkeri]|nr:hypothetical protein CF327_g1500 [Tilletia walkeri]
MSDSSSSASSDVLPEQQRCIWTKDEENALLRLLTEDKKYQSGLLHLWYPRTEHLAIKRHVKKNQPSRDTVRTTLHRLASQLSGEGGLKTPEQVRGKLYNMSQRYRIERSDLHSEARNRLLEELTSNRSDMKHRRRLIRRYHWWEMYHSLVVARERAWQGGAQNVSIPNASIQGLHSKKEDEDLPRGEEQDEEDSEEGDEDESEEETEDEDEDAWLYPDDDDDEDSDEERINRRRKNVVQQTSNIDIDTHNQQQGDEDWSKRLRCRQGKAMEEKPAEQENEEEEIGDRVSRVPETHRLRAVNRNRNRFLQMNDEEDEDSDSDFYFRYGQEDEFNQNDLQDEDDAEDVMQAAGHSPEAVLREAREDADSTMDRSEEGQDVDTRAANGYQNQQVAVDVEAQHYAASPRAFAEHIFGADREREQGTGRSDGNQKAEVVEEGAPCLAMVLFRPALSSGDIMDLDAKPSNIKPEDNTSGQFTMVNAGSSMSGLQHENSKAVELRSGAVHSYELALKKHGKLRSSSQETARTKIIERERTRCVKIKLDAQEREREQWLNFVAERMESSLEKKIRLANEELKCSVLQHVEERLQNLGSSSSSAAPAL